MACRSGDFLNQPISFLLCARPRWKGTSAQPNRKALVPLMRSVRARAKAGNEARTQEELTGQDKAKTVTQIQTAMRERDKSRVRGCEGVIHVGLMLASMLIIIVQRKKNLIFRWTEGVMGK